jgi:hypothetical protein
MGLILNQNAAFLWHINNDLIAVSLAPLTGQPRNMAKLLPKYSRIYWGSNHETDKSTDSSTGEQI